MHSTLALDFSEYVRITNLSSAPIQGRYDGRDYHWEPDEYLDVHKVVAVHIFGFTPPELVASLPPERIEDIKTRAMMRLGWLRVGEDFAAAKERLKSIKITPVPLPDNIRVLRSEDPHVMPRVEGFVPGIAGGSESRTAAPDAESGEASSSGPVPEEEAPREVPDVSALVGGGPRRKPPR